jgi:hypothetical protein
MENHTADIFFEEECKKDYGQQCTSPCGSPISTMVCMNDLSRFSVDSVEKANSTVERIESHDLLTRQIYNVVN